MHGHTDVVLFAHAAQVELLGRVLEHGQTTLLLRTATADDTLLVENHLAAVD